MATIIVSILFWCMPEKKGLGLAAIILSIIGFIFDFFYVGLLAIVDIIFLIVNIAVYNKED